MIVLKPSATIEFIGDSITDCGRLYGIGSGLGDGYVRVIADTLQPAGMKVINRGISGDRSSDLVTRWRTDCLDLAPDVLSIMIGINDTWRRYDGSDAMPTKSFEDNYRALLTSAVAELDAQIVLIQPWLLPVNPDQRTWREDLDPKIDVVNRLAAEFGLTLLPLDTILTQRAAAHPAGTLAADGVHPTALGHQIIAEAWLDLTR